MKLPVNCTLNRLCNCRYLCLQKKVAASEVFETYTKRHPSITKQRGPPFILPLLNFLWLLLSTIERLQPFFWLNFHEKKSNDAEEKIAKNHDLR